MRAKISTETWAQLKIAYASGIGLREMARNMKIPEGTVLSRAQREGWTPSIASVKGSGKARGFPNDGTLRAAVELCVSHRFENLLIQQPTEWQSIGDQIDSAMVFTRPLVPRLPHPGAARA